MPMPMLAVAFLASHALVSEQIAFRCRIGGDLISVRRSGPDLIYQVSAHGRVKLHITRGYLARTGYSGGGELQAVFQNGAWTYLVYERTIRTGFAGHNAPIFTAGVDVLRNGATVSRLSCRDGRTQFSSAAITNLPESDFVEH